jgi:hypothetical protein
MSGFPNQSTRTPTGSTNAAPWQTMGNCGSQDPTWVHEYFNDFNTYVATDWTVTVVGAGTTALTPLDGGWLLSTTSAGVADALYNQLGAASFKIGSTIGTATQQPKDTFFKYSGTLSDVINCQFFAGLIVTSASPLTATDGLYIYKNTGSAAMYLISKIGGVTTTYPFPALCIPTAGVAFEVGIHVDPYGNIEAFWNPSTGNNPVGYNQAANFNQPVGAVVKAYQAGAASLVTTALLNVSFGILNSSAVARSLTTDYIVAERHR